MPGKLKHVRRKKTTETKNELHTNKPGNENFVLFKYWRKDFGNFT